ncbi:hypothetical protein E2K93_13690 [Thalassotalea sp. HSM 43]|uniref:hypothetical protein n=1 Tax=Thalassotalea sp. HSM 43 TaxID=2552945 RepID=UPI00107FD774|nr:hypothetical protein [Thalassotalea sp. HSM 43]QBY05362.1 hypothetical protein E2K93_13690 [Thalassotalea sp. HSM 43]
MEYNVWQSVVWLICGAMIMLCAISAILPKVLLTLMPTLLNSTLARYADIAIRVLFGLSLLMSADLASYPTVFTLLGWLSLIAALLLLLLSQQRLQGIIKQIADNLSLSAVRMVCVFGVALFAFLLINITEH